MHRSIQEFRHAARGLLRTPVFAAGVIVTLALGIGVNATMFGVVDTLFLRGPAGVRNPGGIVRVYFRQHSSYFGWFTQAGTNYPAFKDLRDHVPAFTQTAAVFGGKLAVGRGADATQVTAAAVSAQYFPMLGIRPALGRFFTADEDRVGGDKVAVLSHGLWQRRFGSDSTVIGRTLVLGKSSYAIVGVAPRGFGGIDIAAVELFLPITSSAEDLVAAEAVGTRHWTWLAVVARLAPGVGLAEASSQATTAYRQGATADPEHEGSKDQLQRDNSTTAILGPIQEARGPNASSDAKVSAWIGAVALAVLLITCANVANLLLARGLARRRELAVRASLGAGRGGLIRALLAESLILSASGGGLAIALSVWTGSVARRFLLPDLSTNVPVIDARVLLFTGIAALVTTILIGLLPAIHSSRTDLVIALKSGGHASISGGGRIRGLLVVVQVALTLSLLVGAGLFVRSLRKVQSIDLGFDADRVLMVRLDLDAAGMSPVEANAAYLRMVDRVQRIPGVEHAAAAMGTPFGNSYSVDLRAEGRDSLPHSKSGGPYIQAVSPDYLTTVGTSVLRGRGFTAADRHGAAPVAIVGATFAKMIWPGTDAIGKCLYLMKDPACVRVVGIAADAKRNQVTETESLLYYIPLEQYARGDRQPEINALFVRTRGGAAGLVAAVRREVQIAGNLPFAKIDRLADLVAPQFRSWRLGASAFTAFGLLALLIAATGIFAVLSYSVSQRTKEIGVRVALGAQSSHVVSLILRQGLGATLIGTLLGTVGAYALGRAIASLLYQVPATDPLVFGVVIVMLFGVAIVASYLPARRASRVAPMTALRSE